MCLRSLRQGHGSERRIHDCPLWGAQAILVRVIIERPVPGPPEITMRYWFVLFATIILFQAIAEAQAQTGTIYPSLLIPLEPPETLPPSGTQGGYLFNLRPL